MSSALKPALTTSGPQNPAVMNQVNKPMHPQNTQSTYGQPTGHVSQNLVNLSHNPNSSHVHSNSAHQGHPHQAHQANHYSMNASTPSQHFLGNSPSSVPISNHPMSNVSQTNVAAQVYSTSAKSVPYINNFQQSLGHPANPHSLPPVSQSLPPTQSTAPQQTSNSATIDDNTRSQPNGTSENESTPQTEENHICQKDAIQQISDHSVQKPEKSEPTIISSATADQSDISESKETNLSEPATEQVTIVPQKEEQKSTPVLTSTPDKLQEHTILLVDKASSDGVDDVISPNITVSAETSECSPSTDACVKLNSTESANIELEKSEETPESTNETVHISTTEVASTLKEPNHSVEKPAVEVVHETKSPSTMKTIPILKSRKGRIQKSEADSPKKISPVIKTPGGKSTRIRIRTQPYQSPLPELEIISKITSTPSKSRHDDKLIVFYKNEFLAVRNSEGGFYVCQAVQNIYKSSQKKLKIRWLSQDKNEKSGEIYIPDFYDQTDFDCILTNLNLEKVDKGKFRLPAAEKERTDSILNRSLAAEKGEVEPSLTEEHPDGLDLSLYKDECQLKKSKGTKRKASASLKKESTSKSVKKVINQSKVQMSSTKKQVKNVPSQSSKKNSSEGKKDNLTTTDRSKKRNENQKRNKANAIVDQKKAKMLAKVVKKTTVTSTSRSQPTGKSGKTLKKRTSSVKMSTSTKTGTRTTKRSSKK